MIVTGDQHLLKLRRFRDILIARRPRHLGCHDTPIINPKPVALTTRSITHHAAEGWVSWIPSLRHLFGSVPASAPATAGSGARQRRHWRRPGRHQAPPVAKT